MSNIISMINMKGGVGKTTMTVNLSYELATRFDKKVLLIDMDPQFNATQLLFTRFKDINEYQDIQNNSQTIAGLLVAQNSFVTSGIIEIGDTIIQLSHNLDLIPGDLRLTDFEASARGAEKKLKILLDKVKDDYDYIFIDTPATYSVYSQASLYASDYYIVPMMPDMFATLGYTLLKKKMREDPVLEGKEIKHLGVIINLWNGNIVGRHNIISEIPDDELFKTKISEYEVNRSGTGQNLMSDRVLNNEDIENFANEVLDRISQ